MSSTVTFDTHAFVKQLEASGFRGLNINELRYSVFFILTQRITRISSLLSDLYSTPLTEEQAGSRISILTQEV